MTRVWAVVLVGLFLWSGGCAKYNTYYNAKRAFDDAEHERNEAIRQHKDPPKPTGQQKTNYESAARKAQKVLDEYPGHSLTDDALFLQGKSYYRLESYRMSIRKFDLLFTNYPASPYTEEGLYLQALNYLLIGAVDRSQDYLDLLAAQFPDSDYQAETLKVSGDNAYVLEKWSEAAASFQEYLDTFPDDSERDRIGLKLAECYWELRDFEKAAEVLQDVSNSTTSAELAFRARLLRARVHVRLEDYEVTELLLGELENEAEVYSAQGDVAIIQAENLVAQGRGDDASPLLENLPAEWTNPGHIKARTAEILGNLYLERGELEKAKEKFQESLRRKDALEDENRSRILNDTLSDYLAAEKALPDARPERVPRLKLLQANSLLFGFDRPRQAAQLYVSAALDTAADSTSAARALYGAVLTYRDFLDEPDSAEIYTSRLLSRFPRSPQAFEVGRGEDGDLLGFLLDQQQKEQAERFANLTPEEIEDLNTVVGLDEAVGTLGPADLGGVRRRMIYLARRDNLVFKPSEELQNAADARREAAAIEAAEELHLFNAEALGTPADSLGIVSCPSPVDSTAVRPGATLGPDGKPLPLTGGPTPEEAKQAEEKAAEEKKKKKKDPAKFDLR
nr:tetratricopeptide repeat protein [Candidatus Krumholzibacteria bacterium]